MTRSYLNCLYQISLPNLQLFISYFHQTESWYQFSFTSVNIALIKTIPFSVVHYHTSFYDLKSSGPSDVLRLKIRAPAIFYQLIVENWTVGLCGVLLMVVRRFMKTVTWFKRWTGEPEHQDELRSAFFSFIGKKLYRNRHICDFGNCCSM